MNTPLSSVCRKCCFIILLAFALAAFAKDCTHTNDCFDPPVTAFNRINCSVCDTGVCVYPFSDVFEPDDPGKGNKASNCFYRGDYCTPVNPCVTGQCSVTYARPMCTCTTVNYGARCDQQHALTEYLFARSVLIYFPLIITMGRYTNVEIAPQIPGKDVKVTVTTPEGGINVGVFATQVGRKCAVPVPHSRDWRVLTQFGCPNIYEADIRLPYLAHHPGSVYSGGNLLGYYTYFNISMLKVATNEVVEIHEESFFKIFVTTPSLDDSKCVAEIVLRNCGETWDTATIYGRAKSLNVEADVHHYLDGKRPDLSKESDLNCKTDSRYIWRIWKFDLFTPHTTQSGWIDEKYDIDSMTYPAKKFDFGLYRIQLEVKYTPANVKIQSIEWCYFRVAHSPLELRLDQKLKQKVLIADGILLSVTQSADPNEADTRQGQQHVNFDWTCVSMNQTLKCDLPSKTLKKWDSYSVTSGLVPFTEYTFNVRMWTDFYKTWDEKIRKIMEDKFLNISVTVVAPTAKKFDEMPIVCIKNCGNQVFTNEQMILKVTSDKYKIQDNDTFTWQYYIENEPPENIPEARIVNSGLHSQYIILKENSLKMGKSYYITAFLTEERPVFPYYFETVDVAYDGMCRISPTSGTRGVTEFDITCPVQLRYSYQFEFYDKHKNEIEDGVIYSGRMLGTSSSGVLRRVVLTRGTVMVYVINEIGLSVSRQLEVVLEDVSVTVEYINSAKKKITELLNIGNVQRVLCYLSVVPDMFEPVVDREKIVLTLLDATFRQSITKMAEAKLATSTVRHIVVGMNKEKDCLLTTRAIKDTMKRIRMTTEVFEEYLSDFGSYEVGRHHKYIDSMTIQHITVFVVDSLYSLLLYARNDTFEVNENVIDFDVSVHLRLATKYAEIIVDRVKNVLTYLNYPFKPVEISSSGEEYIIWAVKNDSLFSVPDYLDRDKRIPIYVSKPLMTELLTNSNTSEESVVLQVANCKQNIAWWSRGQVKSNTISLTFALFIATGRLKNRHNLDESVQLLFDTQDIQKTKHSGSVIQMESSRDPLSQDLNVEVHRLDLPPGTLTQIMFFYPPTKDPLRVLVSKDQRPDYTMMTESAVIVNETSPLVTIKTLNDEDGVIHYVGILPGLDVPESATTEYTLGVNTTHCQLWSKGRWSGDGCEFRSNPDDKTVMCSCKHMSLFSVGIPNPAVFSQPYDEFKMLLTLQNNYLIITFTLLLLIMYFIACIWAARQDSKDKFLRIVTILEDNYPSDRHPYLMMVVTSSRLDAGTTAHVAVKIHGDDAQSRIHVLSSQMYTVLRRNTENWFLILCPNPLGNLYMLQLWHDNYGSSPEWYCEKVCVYDLQNNLEFIFPVDQWVALRLGEYPEVAALPAYIEDLKSKKRTFIENCKYEMREGHLVSSIWLRQARSYITRLQRLAILIACVMTALSWSLFFYLTTSHYGVDDWNSDVMMREIWISIEILLINVIFIIFITYAFRKSAKFSHERFRSTLKLRSESTAHLIHRATGAPTNLTIGQIKRSISFDFASYLGTTATERCIRAIFNMKRTQQKVPAYLPYAKVNVQVDKNWYFTAWTVCVAIIIMSVIFIAIWSVKLGKNISGKCLICAFLGIGEHIFIIAPLQILIFSTIFSLGLNLCLEPTTYNVKTGDLKQYRREHDNEKHYSKIIELRNQAYYAPINIVTRESHLIKILKYYRWSLILEFFIAVVFSISISFMIASMWTSNYYSNSHIRQVFNLGHSKVGTVDFYEINRTDDMESYWLGTFNRAAYLLRWYNDQLVFKSDLDLESSPSVYYRLSDYTRKMIGKPLIRQMRVKPIACNSMMCQKNMKCIPSYSLATEDDQDYGPRWTATVAKRNELEKEYSPWEHNDRPIDWVFKQLNSFGGSHQQLNYGGYMVYLSPLRYDSIVTVSDLADKSWLDPLTRAVVTEVTTYNVNDNMFSHVTLFVEFSVTIQWFNKIRITTAPAFKTLNWDDYIFLITLGYLLLVTVKSINKQGPLEYLSKKENVLQVLAILVSAVVVVLLILHLQHARTYLAKLSTISLVEQFKFDELVYYFIIARLWISLLLAIAILRVLCLLEIGRLNTCCYHAIVLSLKYTIALSAIFFIYIVVQWRFVAFIANMSTYRHIFQAFMDSFSSSHHAHMHRSTSGLKTNILATKLCIKLVMFLFVVLFLHFLRVAKTNVTRSFDFFTFILSEIRECWQKRK